MYKSIAAFKELEKHLSYILVYKEYPLPHMETSFQLLTAEQLIEPEMREKVRKYATLLITYCFDVMHNSSYTSRFKEVLNFWGISRPFCKMRCQKLAEFKVNKLSQGRINNGCFKRVAKSIFSHWQNRWMAIGYNSVWYYRKAEDDPQMMRDNIPMDQTASMKIIDISSHKVKLELLMSRRKLLIEVKDVTNGLYVLRCFVKAFTSSYYTTRHRFLSFAPPRKNNDCEFFIDGENYFAKLHDLILDAKQEVMICGWFISPEMPLLRPTKENPDTSDSTLEKVIAKVAAKGVRVYVLVYKEFNMSMYNDSAWCKEALERHGKNVKVLRHPMVFVSLWSHHEKMVIIDRKVVMMGGLDICWGRWDTNDHQIFDFRKDGKTHPNVDYYNPFKKEILHGKQWEKSMIERNYPRMPWHDVAVMLTGQVVFDFLTHFITYWNNAREFHKEREVLFPQAPLTDARLVLNEKILENIQNFIKDIPALHIKKSDVNQPDPNDRQYPGSNNEGIYYDRLQQADYMDAIEEIAFKDIELIKNQKNKDPMLQKPTWMTDHGIKKFQELDDCYYEPVAVKPDDLLEEKNEIRPSTRTVLMHDIGVELVESKNEHRQKSFLEKVKHAVLGEEDEKEAKEKLKTVSIPEMQSPNANLKPSRPLAASSKGSVGKQGKLVKEVGNAPLYEKEKPQNKELAAKSNHGELFEEEVMSPHQAENANQKRPVGQIKTRASLQSGPTPVNPHRAKEEDYIGEKNYGILPRYRMSEIPEDEILFGDDVRDDNSDEMEDEHTPLKEKVKINPVPKIASKPQHEKFNRRQDKKRKSIYDVGGQIEMQALRSASSWSIGLYEMEHSIQNCYIETILNAKRFIYIENQFFISSTVPLKPDTDTKQDDDLPLRKLKNRVVKAIYKRIKMAIDNRETFKVIIFIPLLPAFEANLQKQEGKVMQVQVGLENATIGKGAYSLMNKIAELTNTPEDYIMVCALRRYSYMPKWTDEEPAPKPDAKVSREQSKKDLAAGSKKKLDDGASSAFGGAGGIGGFIDRVKDKIEDKIEEKKSEHKLKKRTKLESQVSNKIGEGASNYKKDNNDENREDYVESRKVEDNDSDDARGRKTDDLDRLENKNINNKYDHSDLANPQNQKKREAGELPEAAEPSDNAPGVLGDVQKNTPLEMLEPNMDKPPVTDLIYIHSKVLFSLI